MDIQKEREAFEGWYVANYHDGDIHPNHHLLDFKEYDQEYVDDLVNMLWEAWQAAKAQAVPEGYKVVPVNYECVWCGCTELDGWTDEPIIEAQEPK